MIIAIIKFLNFFTRDPTPKTSTVDDGWTGGAIKWTPVSPQRMNYLLIEETKLSMKQHPRPEKVALWNLHIPALVNQAVSKAKADNQFFVFKGNTIVFPGLSLFLFVVVLCLVVCITQGARQNDKYKKLLRGNSTTSSNYPVHL